MWQRADVPARHSDADLALDGGWLRSESLDIEYIASQTQGQRVLEIQRRLERMQRAHSLTLPRFYSQLEAGDWVTWTSDLFGYNAQPFRIEQLTLLPDWSVQLQIREIGSSVYAWTPATDEITRANPGPLASAEVADTLVPVTAVLPQSLSSSGNTTRPAIRVEWTPPDDATIVELLIEYRRVGDTPWFEFTSRTPERGYALISQGIVDGQTYQARITPITRSSRPVTTSPIKNATSLTPEITLGGSTPAQIHAALTNFDKSNDRNATPIDIPPVITAGTGVSHASGGVDGTIDLTVDWSYDLSTAKDAANNIDGFEIAVVATTTDPSAAPHNFDAGGRAARRQRQTAVVSAAHVTARIQALTANKWYQVAVRAFRRVDKDISSTGVLYSAWAKPLDSEPTQKFYRPATSVNFTGNLDGEPAANVRDKANKGKEARDKFRGTGDTLPTEGIALDAVTNIASDAVTVGIPTATITLLGNSKVHIVATFDGANQVYDEGARPRRTLNRQRSIKTHS
jgi:hypothetical protein